MGEQRSRVPSRLPRIFILATTAVVYAGLLVWYGGYSSPLTEAEIEAGLAKAAAAERAHGHADNPALAEELRTLLGADDGGEFVMVNLIRFRKHAIYPAGSPWGDDPMAANARYNAIVIPELLKRGCLPFYAATVEGRFLHPDGADDWDMVVMVRYRSRRDLLNMAIALAEKDGDQHKWASIEKTHVFPAKTYLSFFFIRSLAAVVLFGLAVIAIAVIERQTGRKADRLQGAAMT